MRSLLIFILLALPFVCLAQESSIYYRIGDTVFVHAENGLNMRAEAKPSASKVGTLAYGTAVRILKKDNSWLSLTDFGGFKVEDCWYEVQAGNQTGYVFAAYLSRFPPVDERQKNYGLDHYTKTYLQKGSKLVLESYAMEGVASSPCHYVEVFEEGVIKTVSNCDEKCSDIRYVWEDTRVSEIASLLLAILKRSDVPYSVSFEPTNGQILISQDLCEYTISELPTGGVMLAEFCCC